MNVSDQMMGGVTRAQSAAAAMQSAMATVVAEAVSTATELHNAQARIRELERTLVERDASLYRQGYLAGYRAGERGRGDVEKSLARKRRQLARRDATVAEAAEAVTA